MTKHAPKFLATALLAAVSAAPMPVPAAETSAPPASSDAMTQLFGNPVVAKGKGFEIKRSELDGALVNVKASAAARGQNIPPEFMTTVEQQVLDRLIQVQLLISKATDTDKTKGQENAGKRMDAISKRAGSEDALTLQLKSMGLTKDELAAKLKEEATAEAVAERELSVTITDEEARKYYDEHPSKFEMPERVRAAHILLATRDMTTNTPLPEDKKAAKHRQMEDILKRARAGEDFATLAKEYSEDPGSKDKGGEYTFPRGQMVPEFEAAAFTLETNQISDIVTTSYGYHIIKVLEKFPADKLDYAKVSDDIKDGLKQQEMVKKLPEYVEQLRKDANVEILDENLKPHADESLPGAATPAPAAKPAEAK